MRAVVCAVVVAAAVAGGCGGEDDRAPARGAPASAAGDGEGGSGSGSTVTVAADAGGALRFDATRLTATAGTITIRFDNPARVPHAVSVAGESTEVVIGAAAPPIAVELDAG